MTKTVDSKCGKCNASKKEGDELLDQLYKYGFLSSDAFFGDEDGRRHNEEQVRRLIEQHDQKKYQEGELNGRMDEVLRCRDAWHGTDDEQFANAMNRRIGELESQLEKEEQ